MGDGGVRHVEAPVRIEAAGLPPKLISEFIGRVATGNDSVSIAVMESPSGWSEPGQTPEFDEYSLVLDGALTVRQREGTIVVVVGEAVHAPAGTWVQYSTPSPAGARYVSVCVPAFTPESVHRDH
ncbi:MAG: cupin domain-containing protein [Acidimicrobiales bacterium]|jgi:ethanolamine utilization protein EutQ (cupin superfamily)